MKRKRQRADFGVVTRTNPGTVTAAELRFIHVQEPYGTRYGMFTYYAVLAYPCRDEWAKREKFVKAMLAFDFKVDIGRGGGRENAPAAYRQLKNEKIHGAMSMCFHRIEHRLAAASMAYCLWFSGDVLRFPTPQSNGMVEMVVQAPRSVNKAAQALMEGRADDPGVGATNIKHRVWAASMPVLHLAIALARTVAHLSDKPSSDDLVALVYKPHWLREMLLYAESLRSILPTRIPTFLPDKAVCLLPTEDLSKAYVLHRNPVR